MMGQDKLSPEEIVRVDPRRVYELYDHWPADVEDALKIQVDVPRKKYNRVIYLAVGGSATAGDIISDWFLSSGGVEVSVYRGNLPRVSLEDALVIVCSTSGDTEETLEMARTVSERHPDMVAISSGGKLKEMAIKEGIVHVGIRLSKAPRFTLPYSLFAAVATLRSASLLEGIEWELDETVSNLKRTSSEIGTTVPTRENASKRIAEVAARGEPCIYATSVTRSVARRFKTSLNENAKMHATYNTSPDVMHNEVEEWEVPDSRLQPIFLQRAGDPASEVRSREAFVGILEKKGVKVGRVQAKGKGNLSQLMNLCYTLDVASYYTGVLRGVDIFPIRLIEDLKRTR